MSTFLVKKVAILGAGVMGAQIAAHCINARVPVILYDLPGKEGQSRNALAERAVEQLKKLTPAPLADAAQAGLIEVANFDDHLDLLQQVGQVLRNQVDDLGFEGVTGWQACAVAYRTFGPIDVAAAELRQATQVGHGIVDRLALRGVARRAWGGLVRSIIARCGTGLFRPGHGRGRVS